MCQSSPSSDAVSSSGRFVWRNGELLDADSLLARVSPFDHGLLTGDGVFETLVARDGVVYAETRHYRRLLRSAATMGLDVPGQGELGAAMRQVMARNGYQQGKARLRVTVTGGDSPLGSDRGEAQRTVLVAASPLTRFSDTVRVVTVPYARNERGALSGVKSISYGENVVALKYAKNRGGGEAIFGNTRGELCEGSSTNVFAVFGGKLTTPPLSAGCLAGVTRALVLELCGREGIEVAEDAVPLNELANAEEAFLTSTLRDVHPIASVDGTGLAKAPGAVSKVLRECFLRFAAEVPDP